MKQGVLLMSDLAKLCRCNEQLVFSLWYNHHPFLVNRVHAYMLTNLIYVNLNRADIYDDLISRRVHSSDAEKFAELCPCPCNGAAWGVIWWAFLLARDHEWLNTCSVWCFRMWNVSMIPLYFLVICSLLVTSTCRGFISFAFLGAAIYLGLVILSWGTSFWSS